MMDYSREAHEASFYDRGDYEPDDVDLDEDCEKRQSLYRCVDRMCGATDCSNCNPASCEAFPESEPEEL